MERTRIETYEDYARYGHWESGLWIPENQDDTYVLWYAPLIPMRAERIVMYNHAETEIPYECVSECGFAEIYYGRIEFPHERSGRVFLHLNHVRVSGMLSGNHKYYFCRMSDSEDDLVFRCGSCLVGDYLEIEWGTADERFFRRFSDFKFSIVELVAYVKVESWGGLETKELRISNAANEVETWNGLKAGKVMMHGAEKSLLQLKSEELAKRISAEYRQMDVHNLTESYRVWTAIDPDEYYKSEKPQRAGERFRLLEV